MNATAEEIDLAKALIAVGVAAIDPTWKDRPLDEVWAHASDSNRIGAVAIARHVHAHFTPRHDYVPAEKGRP